MLDATRPDLVTRPPAFGGPGSELVPFVAANAWIKAAAQCRFNIEPVFEAAGVKLNPSGVTLVRRSALLWMMRECVEKALPQHHFPFVVGELFAFDYLPAMETFLATSPTLRHAIPALHWVGLTIPSLSFRVEEHGEVSALILDVDAPVGDPVLRGHFVESIFASTSKIIRSILGETKLVDHIEMRHQPSALFMSLTSGFPAPIRGGQQRDAAVFATRLLDMPLPGASPTLHQRAQELVQRQLPADNDSIVDQLERAFRQTPALLGQGIERVAERLALHPRTLQRRLREEGQQFTDVQARSRLEIAKTALVGPPCDIEALSVELGFADRHSFTRAFKRWTGLSPSAWRKQSHGTASVRQPRQQGKPAHGASQGDRT